MLYRIAAVITGSASTTVNFPEGQESCINMAEVSTVLPSPTSPLYVVWPNNDGAGADCICPFCNDATTQCFLSNCYCYNTSLAPKLNVSSLSDSPSLCWPTSLNGTDIYFYAEDRSCSTVPNTRGPLLTRTYVYTARLFERG